MLLFEQPVAQGKGIERAARNPGWLPAWVRVFPLVLPFPKENSFPSKLWIPNSLLPSSSVKKSQRKKTAQSLSPLTNLNFTSQQRRAHALPYSDTVIPARYNGKQGRKALCYIHQEQAAQQATRGLCNLLSFRNRWLKLTDNLMKPIRKKTKQHCVSTSFVCFNVDTASASKYYIR